MNYNNYRLILVRFRDLRQLQKFYDLEFKYMNELLDRNIKIIYRKSSVDNISLYGYDNSLKLKRDRFTQKTFNDMFKLIDRMPMRKNDNNHYLNKNMKYICGLPVSTETGHCFADSTHQTCCMLGPDAREYADNSGNPIGTASVNAFFKQFNRMPHRNDLTPWCTCIGSKVCSFYAERFNDGTHIKFINTRNNNKLAYGYDSNCEKELSEVFNYNSHLTPGVENVKKNSRDCLYKYFNL